MIRTLMITLTLFALSISLVTGLLEAQDMVKLIDGTVLSGELLRMSNDTLFFKTSFSSELSVGRSQVMSIEFGADDAAVEGADQPYIGSAAMGKLLVIITGPDLTTSIRFRHSDDRESATTANHIIFRITANEKIVFEMIDDEIDNEINSEGWTILKNTFRVGRYEVPLPPGEYAVGISMGNDPMNDYRNQFDSGAVTISKRREKVVVYEDGVTTLVLKTKKPFLNLGNYDMKWVE